MKDESACAVVLVCDHLGCVGGQELLQRLCHDYLQALAQQRAQASHVTLLQLEQRLLPLGAASHQRHVRMLDGYSDPDSWLRWVELSPYACEQLQKNE